MPNCSTTTHGPRWFIKPGEVERMRAERGTRAGYHWETKRGLKVALDDH